MTKPRRSSATSRASTRTPAEADRKALDSNQAFQQLPAVKNGAVYYAGAPERLRPQHRRTAFTAMVPGPYYPDDRETRLDGPG